MSGSRNSPLRVFKMMFGTLPRKVDSRHISASGEKEPRYEVGNGPVENKPLTSLLGGLMDGERLTGGSGRDTDGLLPDPLSVEDELVIRKFYEMKIQQVCAAFGFPTKIQATAILFFKRFYLQWSVMEHDAKHIMLTCIYLSCKVEEVYVSAEEFGKGIKQDPKVVLTNELTVLQTLEFELITYAPYRSVEGFLVDLESFLKEPAAALASGEDRQELRARAYAAVDRMMLTDGPLLYPPGQLALAALGMAHGERPQQRGDFDRYLSSLERGQGRGHSMEELPTTLHLIEQLVAAQSPPVAEEEVKRIDRQLKYCRNPALLMDEQRKREKKERQRSKRASHDVKMGSRPAGSPLEENMMQESKRRKSAEVVLGR